MSRAQRRAEELKRAQWENSLSELRAEMERVDALSMHDRIEEAELTGELKDILHLMAKHIGLE